MGFPDTGRRKAVSLLQIVRQNKSNVDSRKHGSITAYTSFRKLDNQDPAGEEDETPLQLTKIYLSCLHDHFISILERKLSHRVVQMTLMDFVVTVPAIWSNAAKQATERAAAMAGFCGNKRIHLISEPVWSPYEVTCRSYALLT